MSQEIRNKVYGIAGAIFLVLLLLGLVSQPDVDTSLSLLDQVLTLVGQGIALGMAILAFVKSLPSRTVTLDLPKADVEAVTMTDGAILAGPASAAPDGTVLVTAPD